ncbi:MAG: hypothetical protein ACOC4C_02545 [Fibrobacterota bacterium]
MTRLNRNIDELVELVKRNRARRQAEREYRESVTEKTGERFESDSKQQQEDITDPSSIRVIVFACESPFSQSLLEMMKRYTVGCRISDPEEALTMCADFQINNVILDLDTPSDCDQAADVFAALKILRPSANVFICSKSTISLESRALVSRGGIRLKKPLLYKDIEFLVQKYVKK